MTKEEFNEKMASLSRDICRCTKEQNALKKLYAETHREFQNGDVVQIITPAQSSNYGRGVIPQKERYAMVVGAYTTDSGLLKYDLRKLKKDGTESKINDRAWFDEYIQLTPNTAD